MKRRVVHVISGMVVGGAEMALYRLVQESDGGRYAHTVIALTPEGGMAERFRATGVDLIILDFRRAPLSHFWRLYRLLRALRPHIVQTWLYHADLFGGLAARLAGIRNVVWGIRATDIDAGCARPTICVRRLCARISRSVPRTIICVAEAARRVHAQLGYDAARMVVIGNGFDLAKLSASRAQRERLRAECGLAPDDIVVGTVGRFNADKDHANFVRAAGLLATMHARLRFLMVGTNLDPGNRTLAQWIGATGHSGRFILLGERSDIPVCLAAMDIFVLPSRTEAFPNALGEAMAMGLPCVATAVGDVGKLMGDAGVMVPKESPRALADGIARLLSMEPAARRRLGRQARRRIDERFSMARTRRRFENLYDNLLAQGGA